MENTKELKKILEEFQKNLKRFMILNVLLIVIAVALISLFLYTNFYKTQNVPSSNAQTSSGNPNSGVQQQSGTTLTNINQPLNSSELAVINTAPLSYYEIAGQKLLNNTLTNRVVLSNAPQSNAVIINGKPSVIYIGAITCPFCGENRWAMALALSRFGNFTALYKGYSSLVDGDTTTLYFKTVNYTTPADISFGSSYISSKINFISSEYESPLSQGFQIQPLSYFLQKSPNATYTNALAFMANTNKFQGTPFSFWGTSLNQGADAVIFGNTSQSTPSILNGGWSHSQVLGLLKNFNSQFAWSEYAAADVYIAQVCPSISNNASVCRLPAIIKIEQTIGTL